MQRNPPQRGLSPPIRF